MMLRRTLLQALPLLPALPAAAQTGTWLNEVMRRLAAIPARQANFLEEKRIAALRQPLISRGRLIYIRPAYLEKITTEPRPEALIVDGDRLSISTGGEAPRVVSLQSRPAIAGLVDGVRAAMAGDLPGLQRFYRVEAQGGLAGWRLILTPVFPPLARVLRAVALEGGGSAISSIRIVEANGDEQITMISEQP
jgi:hypothetical protein